MERVSPELPAWINYLIILFLGFGTWWIGDRGYAQKFRLTPLRWTSLCWYFLLAIDLLFPFVIFWLLDWTGIVSDTSFFAALLTVFVYSQTTTSSSADSQDDATKQLGRVIDVLGRISNLLSARITETVNRNISRNDKLVIERTATNSNLMKILKDEVCFKSPDRAVVENALAAIAKPFQDGAGNIPKEQENEVAQRKSSYLHKEAKKILLETGQYEGFLREKGFIKFREYWHPLVPVFFGMLIVALAINIWLSPFLTRPSRLITPRVALKADLLETNPISYGELWYQEWRLTKARNSAWDIYQAKQYFRQTLTHNESHEGMSDVQQSALSELATILGFDGVSQKTASNIIETLLETHHGWPPPADRPFLEALLEGARNLAPHVTAGAQEALVHVAKSRDHFELSKDMEDMKLSEKSSKVDVDVFTDKWRVWIDSSPAGFRPPK